MTCAKIVGLIQLTQPAVKINDKALYSFALSEVTSIFFIQIICWMYLYSLDLANLETGEKGFSINRTRKLFVDVPVNMALERKIHANAKS